jgi:thioredoxin reductase
LAVKVYEAASGIGSNIRSWGHVRLFSPWLYNIDDAARGLLEGEGWAPPDPDGLPTGRDLLTDYLEPLARVPILASCLETSARVLSISRQGVDKVTSRDRETKPFVLTLATGERRRRDLARAVIDASGTWQNPNPLGADGLPVDGEAESADRIAFGIPDVLGRDRATYAGRRILVVGAGHSAADVLLDLVKLAEAEPSTEALWATRSGNLARVFGGDLADQLPARGELGADLKGVVGEGRVALTTGFAALAVRQEAGGVVVEGLRAGRPHRLGPVDRIVVATGQRPDLAMTRELRLELDPWLEGARALGPLIDPNLHSCGSVPPHGHRELSHPEPGFYTVGIKSYGRAPTFLLRTGYEQVRSVVAALAGDLAAADDVRLILPETGACNARPSSAAAAATGCCGGPAVAEVDACCVADAVAKAQGRTGCGCRTAA